MAAVTETIGLVSGALGIVDFFQNLFPGSNPRSGTVVRVKVGLGDSHGTQLGGMIDSIYGFDINNGYLGNAPGSRHINAGNFADFVIAQTYPGRRGDFVSVANANDATCIEWISVTMSDGTDGGAWTGDIGFGCGQNWYYGNQVAGKLKNGQPYSPRCTWLDSDHTNGIKAASMKFNTGAYGTNAEITQRTHHDCSSTIFSASAGPIAGRPAAAAATKRDSSSAGKRPAKLDHHLVVSHKAEHTAEHLCNHPESLGPDFIGSDGLFCDMIAKTLSPLCSTHDVEGCVEFENNTLLMRTSSGKRSVENAHKVYDSVDLWE